MVVTISDKDCNLLWPCGIAVMSDFKEQVKLPQGIYVKELHEFESNHDAVLVFFNGRRAGTFSGIVVE